ncbi:competence protein ComQ [Natronobacillus azotifigens]|uniref:Polyprenyl synthetase family protein n=1 Tax=Natronobacillus azotifigens TaxID=472978 RepID=A0A9J6RDC1_9BACI|nr:polyprenyl synthetase family protein [Natronobacillus azotifigens]MCZ0703722.1 polyprenyl synthetase family protein [Natronobacillus azotifigens]
MDGLIQERIEEQIRNSFRNDEMESLAINYFAYQSSTREFLFGKLAILHYEMFNGVSKDILSVAASIEIFALAADILDDIQDQDVSDAPWQRTEKSFVLSLASGLLLLSKKVLDDVNSDDHSLLNDIFYSMIFQSMTGQYLDLKNQINNETDYVNIVRKKSSSFVTLACSLGAILANSSQLSLVNQYTEKIGVASQLKNDVQDIYAWDKKSDIPAKKKTFPIIYMLTIKEASLLKNYYSSNHPFETISAKKQEVIEEMEQLGAMKYTKAVIELNKIEALDLINQLDVSQYYKDRLKKFV